VRAECMTRHEALGAEHDIQNQGGCNQSDGPGGRKATRDGGPEDREDHPGAETALRTERRRHAVSVRRVVLAAHYERSRCPYLSIPSITE